MECSVFKFPRVTVNSVLVMYKILTTIYPPVTELSFAHVNPRTSSKFAMSSITGGSFKCLLELTVSFQCLLGLQ